MKPKNTNNRHLKEVSDKMTFQESPFKKKIGQRLRSFREAIRKAQHELAAELNIYQSTITNIERGKTFPNINYLQYFYKEYALNINWLLTDSGEMFMDHYHISPNASSVMECHVKASDPRYEKYAELLNYMEIPEIEQLILARLIEARAIFKDEIERFFDEEERQNNPDFTIKYV
ncbi:MAG: helix-turn-helix transcriptional regulator [bacterium]|nr:helix-turn-helix transcriptional regulator [bacterium]